MRIFGASFFLILCAVTTPTTFLFATQISSAGNPEKGYDFLVNGNYVACGLPLSYSKRAEKFNHLVPKVLKSILRDYFQIDLDREIVFQNPEIPSRNFLNREIAAGFNAAFSKNGNIVINRNCLYCHSEKIGNQRIIGLGNTSADYTKDFSKALSMLKMFANSQEEKQEIDRVSHSARATSTYGLMKTRGVNPAINLTYAFMAFHDPKTLRWSNTPLIEPPRIENVPPVDVPPWWRMKRRKSMFYSGELVGNFHRIMMLASLACVDSLEEAKQLDEPFQNIEAFIQTIPSPKYPHSIDPILANQGRVLFEQKCSRCHGVYSTDGQSGVSTYYPELVIPIKMINTDPELMNLQTGSESERFRNWLSQSYYGEISKSSLSQGYIAPLLDGIWATAPYLHNGSVPSLEALLKSSLRPKFWTRSFDPKDYNVRSMSLKYEVLKEKDVRSLPLKKRQLVYDTTLPGYSNQGHDFGDQLNSNDREALLEYLRTL